MYIPRIVAAGLIGAAALGLSACTDGYGYSGVSLGYGSGYYDDYYGGGYYGSPYWGWYGDYYYPGSGYYVYDRYRRPHRWSDSQRRYWEGRRHDWRGDRREVREGAIPLASTHPQSTCRMGADPATSVVDAFGACHGVRGLFVADMSVFPTSLGAPPQITTAALADRTAHAILAGWGDLAA